MRTILVVLFALLINSNAEAKIHGHHHSHPAVYHWVNGDTHGAVRHFSQHRHHQIAYHDGRPSAWCGFFARHNFLGYDPGVSFNLAWNWTKIGQPVSTPANGELVIWRHHVGKIVGACNGYMCPVWSGNDGHTVRTRVRSVAGAVFRQV